MAVLEALRAESALPGALMTMDQPIIPGPGDAAKPPKRGARSNGAPRKPQDVFSDLNAQQREAVEHGL
jgi:hypothetical protein